MAIKARRHPADSHAYQGVLDYQGTEHVCTHQHGSIQGARLCLDLHDKARVLAHVARAEYAARERVKEVAIRHGRMHFQSCHTATQEGRLADAHNADGAYHAVASLLGELLQVPVGDVLAIIHTTPEETP